MNKIPPKIFIYGFLLTMIGPSVLVGTFLYDWYREFKAAPPAPMIWHQVVLAGGGMAVMYWRKYKAQLELPPDWAAAWSLAQQIKTSKATEIDAEGNVTKTVEKTTVTLTSQPPVEPPKDAA